MYSKRQKTIFKVVAFIIALAMVVTSFAYVFAEEPKTAAANSAMKASDAAEALEFLGLIMDYIYEAYYEPVTYDTLVDGAYKGVFDALDPYSEYYTNEEYDGYVEAITGEFSGVGLRIESYNDQCRVVAVLPDTPAQEAGLKSGDIIIAVDGVKDIPFLEISSKLKGKEGTQVKVTVLRDGNTTLNFTMTRARITLSSVSYEMKTPSSGYILISDFYGGTGDEFKKAVDTLKKKGMKSLIIDLRDNGGGLVDSCIDVAEQIVPKGDIVHYVKKGKVTETFKSTGKGLDIPYVVLVNEFTASASEILAGAIQDNKAGTLVGVKTFGKGVAQSSIPLKNGGGMKLTVTGFVTPNMNDIQGVGITPDVTVLPSDPSAGDKAKEQVAAFAPMPEGVDAKAGDIGLDVYGAQQRLQYLEYENITVNGAMDEGTVTAVKAFQTSHKLKSDGVLTTETKEAIIKAVQDKIVAIQKLSLSDTQLDKALEILK